MSLETQTNTNKAKIAVQLRTLTHVKACKISFAQEKKKTWEFLNFLSDLQNGVKHI